MKESMLYKVIRPIVTSAFKILYRPKIVGKEYIPSNGRIILAGNHTNNLDSILLMCSTKRCIHFLAKIELWKGPKKIIFNNLGLIPVNRKIKDHNVLVNAEKYLEDDKVIGIFPEGTTRKDGKKELLPFKIGAVKMASDTNSKIVPFKITGDYKFFSKNLCIRFIEPITINKKNLDKENDKLRNLVEQIEVANNVSI